MAVNLKWKHKKGINFTNIKEKKTSCSKFSHVKVNLHPLGVSNATDETFYNKKLFLFAHFRFFKRVREAALVPAPHPGGQFWVLHISTQRNHTGAITNIDRRPVARRQQQVNVVPSCLSSHQVLGAAHHLDIKHKTLSEVRKGGNWISDIAEEVSGGGAPGFTLCGQSLDSLPAVRWAGGCGAVERPLWTRVYKEITEASSSL